MHNLKLVGGTLLIALEVIWMLWYIALNAAVIHVTAADPLGGDLRDAVFILGIHIGVILAIILVMGINRKHIHTYIIFVFLFEMCRDVFVILNTVRRDIWTAYPRLHASVVAITVYQLIVSSLALLWCVTLIIRNPATSQLRRLFPRR